MSEIKAGKDKTYDVPIGGSLVVSHKVELPSSIGKLISFSEFVVEVEAVDLVANVVTIKLKTGLANHNFPKRLVLMDEDSYTMITGNPPPPEKVVSLG